MSTAPFQQALDLIAAKLIEDERTIERLLTGLCTDYLATSPAHRGLLTKGGYSKPHNIGVQSAVMFGDYFFVEALMRLVMPGAFSIQHTQFPA